MTFVKLKVQVEEDVATITIDNPRANALSRQVIRELAECFGKLKADNDVRSVILTGAGRFFVAGADINELHEMEPLEAREHSRTGQDLMDAIEEFPKPVVAAINGAALGGGCELAMACHLRICADHAQLGQPEVKLGLVPGFGGTQRLPRLVGQGAALDLLTTGRMVSADEAQRIGLVHRVVAGDEVQARAKVAADELAQAAPLAVKRVREAVFRGEILPIRDAECLEADIFGAMFASEDAKEGTKAFLEKREAVFSGK